MLANTIGAMSSAALAGTLSKISLLKPHTYGPFLLVIMIIAAYQAGIRWGDVVAVVVIGLLAWLMQALKWPRPPLLIGFVLGTGAENYLWISVGRYGWTWLTEPSVVVIGVVIVIARS